MTRRSRPAGPRRAQRRPDDDELDELLARYVRWAAGQDVQPTGQPEHPESPGEPHSEAE